MYSDLIVAFMQRQNDACMLRQALQAMRKQRLLGVDQSLAVSKDQEGRFQPCQADDPPGEEHDALDALATIVQSLLGEEAHTPVAGLPLMTVGGLDEAFVSAVAKARRDSASALLFLLRRDGASDADEVRRVLSLFQTRIYETTLSVETRNLPGLPIEPGSGPSMPTSGIPTETREYQAAHLATSSADGD